MNQSIVTTEEARRSDIRDLFDSLSTTDKGLSSPEAEARLLQYGRNEIPEKKANPLIRFLRYFWGPIPGMIEIATIISAIDRRWADFWIIFTLLVLNAVVGFWQEYKADNAIALLKQRLALIARVRRNGEWQELLASSLVPGDIVRVRLGDIVPADMKLFDGQYLLVDESALTGESLPVEKHCSDVAYAGSIIRRGEMNGLVTTTGMNTYFGKTARLVEEVKARGHFEKALIKIGDYLIVLAIALVAIIFFVSLFRQESMLKTLQFVLVLTVAAIPAALPTVLSVTLAVGAMVLAKKEAIVSKLVSIEEMASMDVLCSDKTGTITKNELTVGEVKPLAAFSERDVVLFATLASREEDHDPIDDAILVKARKLDTMAEVNNRHKTVVFEPFDPVSKRTEATIQGSEGTPFKVSKGAPQAILALAASEEAIISEVNRSVSFFADRGYRALGVAKTTAGDRWEFVGLISLYDPPREDSAETINMAHRMGVNVKMVTGDHLAIAKEVGKQINLDSRIIPASSFRDSKDLEIIVEEANGFAEVFPEHKYRIVEVLQSKGHIVGMTGDGVNDAPALKKADVGIAVSGATAAAKSAADIVLTRSGLSVIVDAIKESRKIFKRMNHYAIYRISETIRVLFFITLSIIIFGFYPINALMIVLLALLNDLPIMTIAYDNVKYSGEPERWDMRMLLSIATALGLMGVFETFGVLYVGLEQFKLNRETLQSFIYLKLSVAGHLLMFMARTQGPFWSVRPAMPLLIAVVATQLIATLITVYGILLPPMGWRLAFFVWGYCLVVLFIIDFLKVRLCGLLDRRDVRFKG